MGGKTGGVDTCNVTTTSRHVGKTPFGDFPPTRDASIFRLRVGLSRNSVEAIDSPWPRAKMFVA